MRQSTVVLACAVVLALALAGARVSTSTSDRGALATAYIFTTTDCPIANRYAPEIQRIAAAYAGRGIRFTLVYVNPRESARAVREHAQRFGYRLETERDANHTLVKRFGITVTPETAVVDDSSRLLYRGRIDDRYVDVGVDRQRATTHEFEDALRAVVTGTPVAVPSAPAVGCIVADFKPVTYGADVAPILADKCASCHRPGGPAPFSLLTYTDARQRASLIASVTERRFMPPYNAVSGVGTFQGQKRLSDAEVSTIRQWVTEDAAEGEHVTPVTTPREHGEWQLGTPDLVVTTEKPYVLQAEPSDVFRIFVIRLPVTATKFVTGIEFLPGNARVVHHANIRLDRTPGSRELDVRDPAPGYDGLLARSAVYPEGHFLGWTPGQIAPLVPSDLAWRLEPGTDLVVQLHMQPSGAPETVQPSIAFYFGDSPPTRTPTILRLGSQGIDIAPGQGDYLIRDSYVLPVDAELHALQPHAHYRLREARGIATLPDGTTRSLIQIDDWDFRWQHVYRFTQPISLPKGTRVAMEYRYDNSPDNPRNPQLPPQRVFWGQRSFDEMGDLWFQFVTESAADRQLLNGQILAKMTAEDIVGYETMLRASPRDAELHDDVALLYLSLGKADAAVEHFAATVQMKPSDAAAHFNLGTALSVAGRFDDAVRSYQRALQLRPRYAAAHNNLGTVLATQQKLPEALAHFRAAVADDPTNVQAYRNLAWFIAKDRSAGPALLDEAVAAGEKAVALSRGEDANVLDALAAAYHAAGAADRARATEARARALRAGGRN
jgi:Tfp pilus assembly protein PilF